MLSNFPPHTRNKMKLVHPLERSAFHSDRFHFSWSFHVGGCFTKLYGGREGLSIVLLKQQTLVSLAAHTLALHDKSWQLPTAQIFLSNCETGHCGTGDQHQLWAYESSSVAYGVWLAWSWSRKWLVVCAGSRDPSTTWLEAQCLKSNSPEAEAILCCHTDFPAPKVKWF